MAKQGEIQLVISAVSAQAKGELDKLTKQYNKLTDEQHKLTEGTEAFAKKAGDIDKVREKMAGLAKQIESGNITTLDRLTKAEKAAERELRGLVEGTEEYIKVSKRLEGVRGEKDKLKAGIADIGKEMQKTSSGFAQFAGGMGDSLAGLAPLGAAAIGAFAVDKLLEFGKGAVSAFNEAENAAFQMHNALVTLGGATEEEFQRLMDQADAIELSTVGFSAEMIQGTQKQLVQFGLTAAEIEKLTPKILDLAAATGKDLASATDDVTNAMIGKDWALGLTKQNYLYKALQIALTSLQELRNLPLI
jgi:archaellum component FlaC